MLASPPSVRRALAALLAAFLLVAGACTGERPTLAEDAEETTTEAKPAGALPPAGALDLEPDYGAALAELGLKLTDRGGLIDRGGGGYEPSVTGTHLALYVEPIADRTVSQYIDGIQSVGAVFADVFERWPGLESFDVCQEPVGEDDPGGREPLPVTQIELTKAESAAIDWATVTVIDLVRAAHAVPPGIALRVIASLASDPAYVAILNAA